MSQGFFEEADPVTGKGPIHVRNARKKSVERISNAEVVAESEKTIDLYFSASDDIAKRILEGGWNPELFTQKELRLTTLEKYAGILAKKNNWRSIIKVVGISQYVLEPSPQYKGKITTKQIIDKESELVPYTLILKTVIPKEQFVGRRSIPNMDDMINMDSPDFIVRDDKKYTRFFLKEWHLDQYLQAKKAKDIEKMFFIQNPGSVLEVPDNTKIYVARYIPDPVRETQRISPVYFRWNPFEAEVVLNITHLDPGNYDRDTLKSVWNPILERHGWVITDINDWDYNDLYVVIESQEASEITTSEDMECNIDLIKELEDTEVFKEILININDNAYISLKCTLYPE